LFFGEAVAAATADSNNDLTRANLLEGAETVTEFDAGGMIVPTNVGGRESSGCFVLMQVRNGEFVRVHPKKKGTFDCKTEAQTIDVEAS